MIKTENIVKRFGDFTALDHVSCTIPDGCIYGMVGSNGAGKSTFLRLITGVYRLDGGKIEIDGQPNYENPSVKSQMMYVPDELFFLNSSSMDRMAKLYQAVYPNFDHNRYLELSKRFGLDTKKNLNTFSKGMKRQAAAILALATRPKYMFFDETFDGLDPIMRNLVKSIICEDVLDHKATAIITSHSLRELEDTCDQLALLHKGGLVFESDVENLKTALFKVQIAFNNEFNRNIFDGYELLKFSKHGSVANAIIRGDRQECVRRLSWLNPVLLEVLPLSLEEVFTYEMEALGYVFDVKEEQA
ncbi:MAG: ABC transporter ATP-binding protein [Clostridia bacterium]|nr:ABC transporter ATP-binding protein [Clostridia bacterium]